MLLYAAPTVADNCTTGLTATFTDGAESGTSCARTIIRTWSAVDACGNTGTVQQTITYTRDVTAPTFTLVLSVAFLVIQLKHRSMLLLLLLLLLITVQLVLLQHLLMVLSPVQVVQERS
jgi:hypothetical protein